jgi:hypothetical protein
VECAGTFRACLFHVGAVVQEFAAYEGPADLAASNCERGEYLARSGVVKRTAGRGVTNRLGYLEGSLETCHF